VFYGNLCQPGASRALRMRGAGAFCPLPNRISLCLHFPWVLLFLGFCSGRRQHGCTRGHLRAHCSCDWGCAVPCHERGPNPYHLAHPQAQRHRRWAAVFSAPSRPPAADASWQLQPCLPPNCPPPGGRTCLPGALQISILSPVRSWSAMRSAGKPMPSSPRTPSLQSAPAAGEHAGAGWASFSGTSCCRLELQPSSSTPAVCVRAPAGCSLRCSTQSFLWARRGSG
jgi:hypothetical protein